MASMVNVNTITRLTRISQTLRNFGFTPLSRDKSSNARLEGIVLTDDGSTIVCWHPEKPFPYECSRPIPEDAVQETNSVLKVQNLSSVYEVFKPKSEEQTREELMKITSTTKHVWFPPNKRSYKKKPFPKDREYL